ncbi:hypothetical protein TMatcc_006409 [Talaromyces marneffei ATCC 18224]
MYSTDQTEGNEVDGNASSPGLVPRAQQQALRKKRSEDGVLLCEARRSLATPYPDFILSPSTESTNSPNYWHDEPLASELSAQP